MQRHPFKKSAFVDMMATKKCILLDGGLSNQLEAQGCDLNNELWSASVLKSNSKAIIEAHLSYLKAGANCIITASYQASISGFIAAGMNENQAKQLICGSVDLANEAIKQYLLSETSARYQPLIAASIGPYGARRADGSEYHGNYHVNDQQLYDYHRQKLSILDNTKADVFACETIPSKQEARILADLLLTTRTPAWVSFSCKNGQHLNDGTPIEDAVEIFTGHNNVLAVGVNCTAPEYINELIQRINNSAVEKTIIVYPNSGQHYNPDSKIWAGSSSPKDMAELAKMWFDSGARIIGGCCTVGPAHIKAISESRFIV